MKIKIPYKYLLFIGLLLYLNIIFLPSFGSKRYHFKEGEIATEDIIAPYNFSIPKTEEELLEERNRIAQRLPPVYDYDPEVLRGFENTVNRLIKMIDTLRNRQNQDSVIYLIQKDIGLPKNLVVYLLKTNYRYNLTKLMKEMGFYLSKGVISSKNLPYRILIVARKDKETLISLDEIFSIAEAESLLSDKKSDEYRQLVKFLIKPNIIFNKLETEKRIGELYANVKKTKGEVLKGELIIEKHKRIDRNAIEKLLALERTYKISGTSEVLKTLIFRNLFFISLFLFFMYFDRQTNSGLFKGKNFYLLLLLLCIYVALGKIAYEIKMIYSLPVAFFILLFSVYFNFYTGFLTAVSFSSIFGVVYNSLPIFMYLLVSGVAANLAVQSLKSRYLLYRPLLYLSIANALAIFFIDNYLTRTGINLINIGAGIMSGFVSIVALAIFLPVFEHIFDFTTDFTLIELGNLNFPLFKEMSMRAPGTYHHSVVVGNLAEAGARAIGANPILARVGAYYHDIGKLKKPEYFIENQIGQKNPHDNLKPQMSALVIISHVKDGVEMGKSMKLPMKILSIIAEHHGTSRIESFYRKALHSSEKISEDVFNYPGPKPKTREAALVMLADSVEATARAEKKYNCE